MRIRFSIGVVSALFLPVVACGQWSDNFDSYATGSQLHGQGGWAGWDNSIAAGAIATNAQALSTPNSVEIVGNSDLVHEYSGYNSGQWVYSGSVFVPTNFTSGVGWFILMSDYANPAARHWSVQLSMDGATSLVTDTNAGTPGGSVSLVRNQWVPFSVTFDLTANTRTVMYNNQLVETGNWTDGSGGTLNLGAVDLFANGGNTVPVYFDDLSLQPVPEPATMAVLGLGALALMRRRRK